MSFSFQFFFILTVLCCINALTPNDICYHDRTSCQNNIKHTYLCGKTDCTVSKYKCQEYFLWTSIFGQLKSKSQYEMHLRNFYAFHTKVNKCEQKVWLPDDVCLNNVKKCASRKIGEIGKLSVKKINSSLKMIQCPCTGKYSFTCGKDFCSLNKRGCDGFFPNSTFKKNDFKKC